MMGKHTAREQTKSLTRSKGSFCLRSSSSFLYESIANAADDRFSLVLSWSKSPYNVPSPHRKSYMTSFDLTTACMHCGREDREGRWRPDNSTPTISHLEQGRDRKKREIKTHVKTKKNKGTHTHTIFPSSPALQIHARTHTITHTHKRRKKHLPSIDQQIYKERGSRTRRCKW